MEIELRQKKEPWRRIQAPPARPIAAQLAGGDRSAVDAQHLLPLVYEELRRIAGWCLRGERIGHTLQRTALVHEVYMRLTRGEEPAWNDRGHFFAIAARAMRQVLVDYALHRRTEKRGGGWERVPLDEAVRLYELPSIDLIALNEALEKLQTFDKMQAQIVDLRFFAGLTVPETASALHLPVRTVEREWSFARAWLRSQISGRIENGA